MDKQTVRLNFSILLKYLICLTMAIIIYFALSFVFTSLGTTQTGYTVYGLNEQDEVIELYTHKLSDGEDALLKQYEDEGREIRVVNTYSKLASGPKAVMLIICQICTLGTLVMFLYPVTYNMGDSDGNKVQFGRMQYDRFKGLKMGIASALFSLITYMVLILGKAGFIGELSLAVFRFANYHLVAYNELVIGSTTKLADIGWLGVLAAFLNVIVVPIICHICYTLGYKRINLFEKMVFIKK